MAPKYLIFEQINRDSVNYIIKRLIIVLKKTSKFNMKLILIITFIAINLIESEAAIGGYCSSDSSCSSNQVCVDYKCECAPNYRWDSTQLKCNYFTCNSILDCDVVWDSMRVCSYGSCVCYSSNYYQDYSNGGKCTVHSGAIHQLMSGRGPGFSSFYPYF